MTQPDTDDVQGEPGNDAELVERINKEYAVILLGDRPSILRETVNPDGEPVVSFLAVQGFIEWLRPHRVWRGRKSVAASEIWLAHPWRRQYEGLGFFPDLKKAPANYYNQWRGFALEPNPYTSCQRFLTHVADNVCNGDSDLYAWVMGWFAAIIQRPDKKIGTSIALRGKEGVGKTIVGQTVGSLMPRHYILAADARYVTGRFNSHLLNCLFLQLDEAVWAGDHAAAGKLKDLITGREQIIELKGREPIKTPNLIRLLLTTNNDWAIPAGLQERRFAVLDVAEYKIGNSPYFAAINEELDRGGRGALLHYLQTYDLTDVPLHTVPGTAALAVQKIHSLSPEQAWWLDILNKGELPGDTLGRGITSTTLLYEHYIDTTKARNISRRAAVTQLGCFLHEAAPGIERDKVTLVPGGRQVWGYIFPPLTQCRTAFSRRIGQPSSAEREHPDWSPEEPPSSRGYQRDAVRPRP